MPELKTIRCRLDGIRIRGKSFGERMAKLRRHYKRRHPEAWRESIKRGVQKRKAGASKPLFLKARNPSKPKRRRA